MAAVTAGRQAGSAMFSHKNMQGQPQGKCSSLKHMRPLLLCRTLPCPSDCIRPDQPESEGVNRKDRQED